MIGGPVWFGTRHLLRQPLRVAAALLAIAAAVLVIAVETGFFFGILDTQSKFATMIDGDLVLLHRSQVSLDRWNDMPGIRPYQAGGVAGVRRVVPIYRGGVQLLNADDGRRQRAVVLALPADAVVLKLADPAAVSRLLKVPGQVLFDTLSRDLFGTPAVGDTLEIDGRNYRVGGRFTMGPNLVYDGVVLMSEGDWLRHRRGDDPLFAVVELLPGSDRETVRAALRRALPDDVLVVTPAELRAREIGFTVKAAPIGYIFGLGALLGLVVGMIFSYQVLYNEVMDCRAQFNTLRAMGFGPGYLTGVIASQGVLLGLVGAAIGLAASAAAYRWIAGASHLVMELTLLRAVLIALSALLFCLAAGWAAARQLQALEPAELL